MMLRVLAHDAINFYTSDYNVNLQDSNNVACTACS